MIKIENMVCGGWKCKRIFKIDNRIDNRYCSEACRDDWNEREKTNQFNYWDKKFCVCGCWAEGEICYECGNKFGHALDKYCYEGECSDHVPHNENPDHCHNEDGDCEIHPNCETQCSIRE